MFGSFGENAPIDASRLCIHHCTLIPLCIALNYRKSKSCCRSCRGTFDAVVANVRVDVPLLMCIDVASK